MIESIQSFRKGRLKAYWKRPSFVPLASEVKKEFFVEENSSQPAFKKTQ